MRVKAHFSGILSRSFDQDFLTKIREVVPDGRDGRLGYEGKVYIDDPRYTMLRQYLNTVGLNPWDDGSRLPDRMTEYELWLWREYEPRDFADCRYLQFNGFVRSKVNGGPDGIYKLEMGDNVNGMISLNEGELDPKHSFLRCCENFFCSDRAKRVLEAQNFIGLSFIPTMLRERLEENVDDAEVDRMGDVVPWEKWGPPWWQMMADRVMPPLSPSMTFVKSRLKEYYLVHPPLDDPNYCYTPHDGLYTPVELRYRLSDLNASGPMDYARTREKLGASSHPIIVSKRFYDCCQAHGLESDWVPVRIDA